LISQQTAADQGAISGKYLFDKGDIVYSKIRPYLRKAILARFGGLCSADMYPLKPASDVCSGFMLAVLLGDRFSKYAESVSVRSGMPKINRAELAEYVVALPPFLEQEAIAEVLSKADALIENLERLIAKKRLLKKGVMQQLLTGKRRLRGFANATTGYKQTEVGVIPEDWAVTSMGELFTFQNGVNAGKAAYGKGTPFINVLEVITCSTLVEAKIPGRISLLPQAISTFRVQTGDVLFNRTSETQEEVGLASVYIDNREVVFGGFVIRARPQDSTLDPMFSSYALRSPAIRRQIISRGQGAVRANIGQQELSKVQVFVPPFHEQDAIAEVLSAMDAEIILLEAQLAKYRQLKQGLMQKLLTGKIRLV
jgi:type I restriction enzyme S subunit